MWYEPETMSWSPTELGRLGNLSLTQNHDYGGEYHGQVEVQRACRVDPQYGASYDWVLVVDADEYLWLG